MIKVCLLLFCLLVSSVGFSQATYGGRVVDEDTNESLEAVAITLLRTDSVMVSYAYSSAEGVFKVVALVGIRVEFISFSSMGYKRQLIPVSLFRAGSEVRLKASAMQIREVQDGAKIRACYGIIGCWV